MGKWFIAANGIIGGMQRIVDLKTIITARSKVWKFLLVLVRSLDPCKGYQCHRADVPFFDTKLRNCWFRLKIIRREYWASILLRRGYFSILKVDFGYTWHLWFWIKGFFKGFVVILSFYNYFQIKKCQFRLVKILALPISFLLNLNIFSDIAVVAHSQTRLKNFMSPSYRVIQFPHRTVPCVRKTENV